MEITAESWARYIAVLRQIDDLAAAEMLAFVGENGLSNVEAVIAAAYLIASKYAEASAALAAEMYDAVSILEQADVPPAESAPLVTVEEISTMIYALLAKQSTPETISAAVARWSKMAAMDTIAQNAQRDGAEMAWVPQGETCAFCIFLASQGWKHAGKSAFDGQQHTRHVHNDCDCMFAVRHNRETRVGGYNPIRYRAMLDSVDLDGRPPTDKNKINALRRQFYAENTETINAKKRSAYEKRQERESDAAEETDVGE